MDSKLVVVLFAAAAAAISCCAVANDDVDTFSFPAFDDATLDDFIAVNNTGSLQPASLLFQPDRTFADFNRSEGFLLLARPVGIWRARAGSGGVPDREASFNTTFTLAPGPTPVAFVVLGDTITLDNPVGLRGPANASVFGAPDGRASDGLAAVEAGVVRSFYRPDDDDDGVPAGFGLNVTITPNNNGTAAAPSGRTVWIEYDAGAHRLSVFVAAGGRPKPARPVLDAAELFLAGRRTTETALVGFFGATIRDVVVGVSGWELTVDALPGESGGNRNKETSWVMMLLAVLLSLAATAAT